MFSLKIFFCFIRESYHIILPRTDDKSFSGTDSIELNQCQEIHIIISKPDLLGQESQAVALRFGVFLLDVSLNQQVLVFFLLKY